MNSGNITIVWSFEVWNIVVTPYHAGVIKAILWRLTMYSVDDLNLTAYGRKLPYMTYKPIIAPFLAKRACTRAAQPLPALSGANVSAGAIGGWLYS